MFPGAGHFWMLFILCLTPLAVHLFRKPLFFNSSVSNGIFLALLISILKLTRLDPEATVSTILFISCLIFPLYIQKKLCEHILNQNFKKTQKWLPLLKLLSPAFPVKECKIEINRLMAGPETVSTEDLLTMEPGSIPSLIASIQMHFLKTEWSTSEKWLEKFNARDIERNPWLTLLKLRVLCEMDQLEEAVQLAGRVKEKQNQHFYFIYHLIYLCAFCGHQTLLAKIFNLPIKELKDKNRDFWTAVCLYFDEPKHEEGKALLEGFTRSSDKRIAGSSQKLLSQETDFRNSRYQESVTVLSEDLFVNLEDYLGPARTSHLWTNILFTLNLVMYFLTRPDLNSSFPYNNLSEKLVLFLPESVDNHEWWRLLTTTFLHGSFLHFISNAMMLLIFGYMVEPFFNTFKFLFIYLGAGIAGMILVTAAHNPSTLTVTLGASGSTMALMGAYIAVLLKQNSRSSVKLRKQQLIFLFLFILVQSRIDYISPQISFTAHISGLVFGLISAYIFYKPLYTDLENQIEQASD